MNDPDRFTVPPVTTQSAAEAMELVLAGAGATAPGRDPVDSRIVREVRNRSGRIIDSPDDVGGYPTLKSAEPPPDSDHDGMPDSWERERGLDPNDPADGPLDADGDGYTTVEGYLHSLL